MDHLASNMSTIKEIAQREFSYFWNNNPNLVPHPTSGEYVTPLVHDHITNEPMYGLLVRYSPINGQDYVQRLLGHIKYEKSDLVWVSEDTEEN